MSRNDDDIPCRDVPCIGYTSAAIRLGFEGSVASPSPVNQPRLL